jgi:hypothetical protein
MDAQVLPGLDGSTVARERIIGVLHGGWMIDDGQWRLARYATGEALLFNRPEDPLEQHNLIADPGYLPLRNRLESELAREIMASTAEAFFPRRVDVRDLSQTVAFGREGWQRPYPRDIRQR